MLDNQPLLLYADEDGRVMNHEFLLPAARSGSWLTDVQPDEWIPLPHGATLTWLPGTRAVGMDPDSGEWRRLPDDCYAVGALLPQGFTRLLLPGYTKRKDSVPVRQHGSASADNPPAPRRPSPENEASQGSSQGPSQGSSQGPSRTGSTDTWDTATAVSAAPAESSPAAGGGDAVTLPLFGYTAVGWRDGEFVVAAHRTADPEPWDPTQVSEAQVEQAVAKMLALHPDNRLFRHLAGCALEYGCMTAKNTFLARSEGALPVSSTCNAGCVGCISEQPDDAPFPSPQTRLQFWPTPDELADVMLTQIGANPQAIVSFGQGCEGEPTTRALHIVQAIRRVREQTDAGYININTNAGMTKGIRAIVDAGLDLMRVSTISAIDAHYNAYYKPRGYDLQNVAASLCYARDHGVYTSINYLVFPGVTDREEEVEAMVTFLQNTGVQLVQMRNLNIDPEYYLERILPQRGDLLGMAAVMEIFQEECPGLRIGSYTQVPPMDWPRRSRR